MRDRALRFTLAILLGVSACGETGGDPVITEISPLRAYSDGDVTMVIKAPALRPALVVDVEGESASYDDGTIHAWLVGEPPGLRGAVSLAAPIWNKVGSYYTTIIPKGTAAGHYAVRIDGPNGRSTTLHGAFEELGPDTLPPLIVVQTPSAGDTLGVATAGTAGASGTSFTAMIFVDDDPGQLREVDWATSDMVYGTCPLSPQLDTMAPPSQTSCKPPFEIAPLRDDSTVPVPFSFRVVAIDVSGQVAVQDVTLSVAPLPIVDSFEGTFGSLAGLQRFVVHGRYFLPGSQAFIDGVALMGDTVGGDRLDDQTIVGLTPPRLVPNTVSVEVRNLGLTPFGIGLASSSFRYLAPPQPRLVEPTVGPTSGGILVTIAGNDLLNDVTISFGRTRETAQPMCIISIEGDDKVVGYLPPGQPGTVSIWTGHPITGLGAFPSAFTYSADAGTVPNPPPCPTATTP